MGAISIENLFCYCCTEYYSVTVFGNTCIRQAVARAFTTSLYSQDKSLWNIHTIFMPMKFSLSAYKIMCVCVCVSACGFDARHVFLLIRYLLFWFFLANFYLFGSLSVYPFFYSSWRRVSIESVRFVLALALCLRQLSPLTNADKFSPKA